MNIQTANFSYNKKSYVIKFLIASIGTYYGLQLIITNVDNISMQMLGGFCLFILIPVAVNQLSKILSRTYALSITEDGILLNVGNNQATQILWSDIHEVKEVIITNNRKFINIVLNESALNNIVNDNTSHNNDRPAISIPTWILNCKHDELFSIIKRNINLLINS